LILWDYWLDPKLQGQANYRLGLTQSYWRTLLLRPTRLSKICAATWNDRNSLRNPKIPPTTRPRKPFWRKRYLHP